MPFPSVHDISLTRHPATPCNSVRSIAVRVNRHADGLLALTYVLEGDLDRLRVPTPQASRFTDELWEHTCCEIFIARQNLSAYHELNFSPSTQWATYVFERYREGRQPVLAADPRIAARHSPARLELEAAIQLDRLSLAHVDTPLSLAVSTVVEDMDGTISYWAYRHSPGEPDFHHADAFALTLPG